MAKRQRSIKVAASSKKQNIIWGIILVVILGAAGYVVMGNSSQELGETTPVAHEIPAPTPVITPPIPTRDIGSLTQTQKELLQKAREYKLALLTFKTDELKSKSESTVVSTVTSHSDYVSPQGTPDDIPADPKGSEYIESSTDTVVRMIIGSDTAWLERSGERRQVGVGGDAWGKTVSRITPNSVCFGGKKPYCVYIEG